MDNYNTPNQPGRGRGGRGGRGGGRAPRGRGLVSQSSSNNGCRIMHADDRWVGRGGSGGAGDSRQRSRFWQTPSTSRTGGGQWMQNDHQTQNFGVGTGGGRSVGGPRGRQQSNNNNPIINVDESPSIGGVTGGFATSATASNQGGNNNNTTAAAACAPGGINNNNVEGSPSFVSEVAELEASIALEKVDPLSEATQMLLLMNKNDSKKNNDSFSGSVATQMLASVFCHA